MAAYITTDKTPLLGRREGRKGGRMLRLGAPIVFAAFFFLLFLRYPNFLIPPSWRSPPPPPPYIRRVAIIGAGPAGASAAYHLHHYAEKAHLAHEITVFEQSPAVGGQATCKIQAYNESDGQTIELGAGHFTGTNKLLLDAARNMGWKARMVDDANNELVGDGSGSFGVYDGTSWLYLEPNISNFLQSWWWWVKMFYFYGLSPQRAKGLISEAATKRNRMYSPSFFPFDSVNTLVQELDLEQEAAYTAGSYFSSHGISENFQQEIINPWVRRRYGQNLNCINAFVAMLAAEGAAKMTVPGGISKLMEGLVKTSKAELHLETTVLGMRQTPWAGWVLATQRNDASDHLEDDFEAYDDVIIATPWKDGKFEIKSDPLRHTPKEIPYEPLHTVVFTSEHHLSPDYFAGQSPVPNILLTTLSTKEYPVLSYVQGAQSVGQVGFWAISMLKEFTRIDKYTRRAKTEYLYKLRSADKIDNSKICEFLGRSADDEGATTWIYRHYEPEAYPSAPPRTAFGEVNLDEGLWYTSVMDELTSGSVDMSSLMGANVARLIVDQWVAEGKEPPEAKRRPKESVETQSVVDPGTEQEFQEEVTK